MPERPLIDFIKVNSFITLAETGQDFVADRAGRSGEIVDRLMITDHFDL
jgi:hypothetical protein